MQTRFTDARLKFRINQSELAALKLCSDSNHALRHSQKSGITFEPGSGGFQQFISEFYTRATRINGLEHMGYHEVFHPSDERFHGEDSIKNQLTSILAMTNITMDDIEHIIAAHSQGPLGTIAYILGYAINEPEHERERIHFKQPHTQHVIFYRDNNSPLFARVQLDYFPIANYDGHTIGILPGPVEITYTIVQKNIGNSRDTEKVWGYELQYIETSNADIVKALHDYKFDPRAIRQSYCQSSQIDDFKKLTLFHLQWLTENDVKSKFIFPPLSQPQIEPIETLTDATPAVSKLSFFAQLKQKKNAVINSLTTNTRIHG